MVPLEDILSQVYPKFGLDLVDPQIVVTNETTTTLESAPRKGNVEFRYKPDIWDENETRYLEGITFYIPSELSEDPQIATGFFAHECSHIEHLKRPYQIIDYIALTFLQKMCQRSQERHQGVREWPSTILGKLGLYAEHFLTVAAYIPIRTYHNIVERIIDNNARAKGFRAEIDAHASTYEGGYFK